MGPKSGEQKRTGTQKIYRTLGKTGIKLPVITMGVMNSDNPALMRAYLDVYGYRNLSAAQDLILSLNLPLRICENCSSCSVGCLNRFNISERVRNVVRLREVSPEFIT
jgi:hypothetical protein